jgi:hypothetical protein
LALHVVPQRLDVVTVSTMAEGVITTTSGDTILVTEETKIWPHDCETQEPVELDAIEVPEATPIIDLGTNDHEYLDLEALAAGDQIKVIALKSCDDDDGDLTAHLIVLTAS